MIHVDATRAQGPITIDPFVQTAQLTASDGKSGDLFGNSVAVSGNTVVVGAYDAAGPGGNLEQGKAYVFTEPVSGWTNATQTAELTASDGKPGDWFGYSIAIDGSTVVVLRSRPPRATATSSKGRPTSLPSPSPAGAT